MATYAIGDVQGCFDELRELLDIIHYKPNQDCLWFVGDLVNRGPKSLTTLRFIKNLAHKIIVLGNHDLYLLALAAKHPYKEHNLHEILTAPDCDELINWLRYQPLLHHDPQLNYVMVHAGIPPQWDINQAKYHAKKVEQELQSDHYSAFILHVFDKKTADPLRYCVDALTRMRFCTMDGELDLDSKGELTAAKQNYFPWFKISSRKTKNIPIIFGHWAALQGNVNEPNLYALDTGCVWGNKLRALRLEDKKLFEVKSSIKPD